MGVCCRSVWGMILLDDGGDDDDALNEDDGSFNDDDGELLAVLWCGVVGW